MSYAQYGLIEATDFNNYVGTSPNTSSGVLNTVWSVGGTTAGYGQTAVPTVTVGTTVTASDWANLVTSTSNSASHQGTSISSVSTPTAGNIVTYVSSISTNLTSIYNSRLNAIAQGSTTSNTATYATTWSSAITFTHTATFANGDAARYFFNSGGQLAITCSHPGGTGINLLLNNLASNIGTVVLSAPSSGTATIASTSYNGVTKIGGGGNAPTISQNTGYYALTTANATVFTQTASTGPAGYLSTFIRVIVKSNGTQGSNGDTGSVITVYTIWDEVPDGLVAAANSATTLTVRPPATTYISNTWGAITLSGTASGS
jgi:hypothetical protein